MKINALNGQSFGKLVVSKPARKMLEKRNLNINEDAFKDVVAYLDTDYAKNKRFVASIEKNTDYYKFDEEITESNFGRLFAPKAFIKIFEKRAIKVAEEAQHSEERSKAYNNFRNLHDEVLTKNED